LPFAGPLALAPGVRTSASRRRRRRRRALRRHIACKAVEKTERRRNLGRITADSGGMEGEMGGTAAD